MISSRSRGAIVAKKQERKLRGTARRSTGNIRVTWPCLRCVFETAAVWWVYAMSYSATAINIAVQIFSVLAKQAESFYLSNNCSHFHTLISPLNKLNPQVKQNKAGKREKSFL